MSSEKQEKHKKFSDAVTSQTVDKVLAFCRGFFYEKGLKISNFKTFKPFFGIMNISKKAVSSYDDSRN